MDSSAFFHWPIAKGNESQEGGLEGENAFKIHVKTPFM